MESNWIEDVAALEQAHAEGRLKKTNDLDAIRRQVARAEDKILKAVQGSPLLAPIREMLLGDAEV